MSDTRKGKLDGLNLLALKTLVGLGAFILVSIPCIVLIAINTKISEGLTMFASTYFALVLAIMGISGWQAIQQRKTEWEPSQEAKDTIQLNRHLNPDKPIITNATTEHPVMVESERRQAASGAGMPDDGAVG